MILFLILITSSHENVWISLGENWCWSLLGLKGLRDFLQRLCLVSQLFSILGQTVIPFAFVANLDDLSTFSTNNYLKTIKSYVLREENYWLYVSNLGSSCSQCQALQRMGPSFVVVSPNKINILFGDIITKHKIISRQQHEMESCLMPALVLLVATQSFP